MRAYQDMVFSTAVRITASNAHAEDIAQEVFLKAYENFDSLRGNERAGGWLRTVARNLSLNHVGRYRRRWRFFSELRNEEDEDEGASFEANVAAPDRSVENVSNVQRQVLVEQALRSLPERQRVPLVLFHFEDMTYEDIAKHLKVSLSKVKIDIHRARAALASALARCGITEQ